MKGERHFELTVIIVLLICLVLSLNSHSPVHSMQLVKGDDAPETKQCDVSVQVPKGFVKRPSYIGIKDPDGKKSLWVLSQDSVEQMKPILHSYPYKTIDGIKFYEVSSWGHASKLMMASRGDIEKMVWNLFNEILCLKSRVEKLEKKISVSSKTKETRNESEP